MADTTKLSTEHSAACVGGPRDGDAVTFRDGDELHRMRRLVYGWTHVYQLEFRDGNKWILRYDGKMRM